MFVGILFLFVAFVVTRVLLLRNKATSTTANVVGGTIIVAFFLGSLVRPFGLPGSDGTVAGPPPTGAPVASGSLPPLAVHDVSASCNEIRATAQKKAATGVLDALAPDTTGSPLAAHAIASREAAYTASGWALDKSTQSTALAACAVIDGKPVPRQQAEYGILRADVAGGAADSPLAPCGFRISIRPGTLPIGHHTFAVWVWSHDGSYAAIADTWTLDVR